MSEIPEDVWKAAREAAAMLDDDDDWPVVRVAAAAIMAERERCAEVADDYATFYRRLGCVHRHHITEKIAKEIRMGDRSTVDVNETAEEPKK